MFKLQTFDVYSRARGKIFFHDFLKGITVKLFALRLKTGLPHFNIPLLSLACTSCTRTVLLCALAACTKTTKKK